MTTYAAIRPVFALALGAALAACTGEITRDTNGMSSTQPGLLGRGGSGSNPGVGGSGAGAGDGDGDSCKTLGALKVRAPMRRLTRFEYNNTVRDLLKDTSLPANAFPSEELGVRWVTGKSHGLLSPINSATFEDSAKLTPLPPQLDPQEIFDNLFGSLDPMQANAAARRVARRKSVLDFVDKRYVALQPKLGAADKAKLENHLTKLRAIEKAVTKASSAAASVRRRRARTPRVTTR